MKQVILLMAILITFICQAQNIDKVIFYKDSTTNKLFATRSLVITPTEPQFTVYVNGTKDGNYVLGLWVQLLGNNKCNGDNTLTLLFIRGQKIRLESNSVMNCNGLSYFPLKEKNKEILKNYRVYKIRFKNGRNRNYHEKNKDGSVSMKDWDYFIERFYASENIIFSNNN